MYHTLRELSFGQRRKGRREEGMDHRQPTEKSPTQHGFGRLAPAVPAIVVLAAVLAVGLFAIVSDHPCPLSAGRTEEEAADPAHAVLVAGDSGAAGPAHAVLVAGGAEAIVTVPDQVRGKAAREAIEKLIAEQKFEAAAAE